MNKKDMDTESSELTDNPLAGREFEMLINDMRSNIFFRFEADGVVYRSEQPIGEYTITDELVFIDVQVGNSEEIAYYELTYDDLNQEEISGVIIAYSQINHVTYTENEEANDLFSGQPYTLVKVER